ncbi:SDR family oxidoreductase [Saccharothrix luteola]|uniref:SDR family oxidoreductase n=1 Tax=Saccharothrix luteola TaxID=2893018 RepID=UPI001E4F4989|nr:NAD(P)H-binding protein [Saccharothrix luteola]MCC8247510.1 NAD(P)H-binding protein [Saccharothrix luteola]
MTSILVTGGTGTLGRLVVPLLDGHRVRVLSRHGHGPVDGVEHVTGDLLTGEGVEAAVDGVEIVLHLAGGPKGDAATTGRLVRAASATGGVRHFVHISAIGADRVPLAWFREKLGAERAVADSGLPWTTLRAAQFHDLVLTVVAKMAKLPVVPIPGGLRFEPVDARDVAERLVELTLGAPAGLVPDLAGPEVHGLADLVRGYLAARDKRRPALPVRMPGKAGRAYRAGGNLAGPGAARGRRPWEDFLAERVPADR